MVVLSEGNFVAWVAGSEILSITVADNLSSFWIPKSDENDVLMVTEGSDSIADKIEKSLREGTTGTSVNVSVASIGTEGKDVVLDGLIGSSGSSSGKGVTDGSIAAVAVTSSSIKIRKKSLV